MRFKFILYVLASVLLITSCQDEVDVQRTETFVTIKYPTLDNMKIKSEKLTFKNISTGEDIVVPVGENYQLPKGLYTCSYKADITYDVTSEGSHEGPDNPNTIEPETVTLNGKLSGKLETLKIVSDETQKLDIEVFLYSEKDDFIFEEIFFTGTQRSSGSSYFGDTYFKIYNNTDHVLYADGLAICESKFKSNQFYVCEPDIRRDTFTIQAIYLIPGNGKEHPVQPGESLLICDTGIDHRTANPNSLDFSDADFEWYDISSSPSHMDIDSPTVPNLDKWYCYSLSFWVLNNRGLCSYALARIPIDKETYLKDYFYHYNYTLYLPSGTYPMEQSAYKLPNSWIVDGVNCSIEATREWDILPASIDAGWTHCGKIDHDKERFFKSVRRKVAGFENGRCILQDTNNSTDDFNTECVPSEIEKQGTSIDAQGNKPSGMTWDGVTPKV